MEALILVGGEGTRLHEVTKGLIPKCMVDVKGKPFLERQIEWLKASGVERVVLATNFKYLELLIKYFGYGEKLGVEIAYSIEGQQLGTGGAIKRARGMVKGDKFFILYGDIVLDVNLYGLMYSHEYNKGILTVTAPEVMEPERFGQVITKENSFKVIEFKEKSKEIFTHNINGGIYVANEELFKHIPDGEVSFEREVLPKLVKEENVYAFKTLSCFIDIGVPNDYKKYCELVDKEIKYNPDAE